MIVNLLCPTLYCIALTFQVDPLCWDASIRWEWTEPRHYSSPHCSISKFSQSSNQKECLHLSFSSLPSGTSIWKFMNNCPRHKSSPSTNGSWIPVSSEARGKGRRTIKGGREKSKITTIQMGKQKMKSGKEKGEDQQMVWGMYFKTGKLKARIYN